MQSSVSKKYNETNFNTINDVHGETLNMEFQSCTSEEVCKVVQSGLSVRSISVSNILETVVHKGLYNFLQMNRILSQTQFGFRKDHSTTQALKHQV